MNKNTYKIVFYDEEHKPLTIYAQNVYQSDILGFVTAEKLLFPEPSEIIVTPDQDKIRNMFKNTEKTIIPINLIIRIDEVTPDVSAPVINIYETEK